MDCKDKALGPRQLGKYVEVDRRLTNSLGYVEHFLHICHILHVCDGGDDESDEDGTLKIVWYSVRIASWSAGLSRWSVERRGAV